MTQLSRLAAVCASLAIITCGGGGGTPPSSATPTSQPSSGGGSAGAVRFTIDSTAPRQPISPFVYGTNDSDWAGRSRGLRLGRLGGNRWTAYNWETNASNAGSDFQHQNDGFLGGGERAGRGRAPARGAAPAPRARRSW